MPIPARQAMATTAPQWVEIEAKEHKVIISTVFVNRV